MPGEKIVGRKWGTWVETVFDFRSRRALRSIIACVGDPLYYIIWV